MSTHESGINYQNLIRDLADMYSCDIAEVVLIELIANSLDAGATSIKIDFSPHDKSLVVEDNGSGMNSNAFDQYHDFAAGLKTRGTGIGFAGVGAKISFNIADRVITETRSKTFSGGSNWYLQSKNLQIGRAHV
jgi:signal transduction histidine kinase